MSDTTIAAHVRARLLGSDHMPGAGRRAAHDLADALRDATHALAQLDPESADPAALAPLTGRVRELTAIVRGQPDLTRYGSAAVAPLPASYLPERSPVSGRTNALAPPSRYTHDGARTRAHVTYGAAHEGPAGGVHGGVIAAAFDELLGVAQMASGAAGYTGELTVRFRRITPLHVPITYEAHVEARAGRRLTLVATSTDDGRRLAEAADLWMMVRVPCVGTTGMVGGRAGERVAARQRVAERQRVAQHTDVRAEPPIGGEPPTGRLSPILRGRRGASGTRTAPPLSPILRGRRGASGTRTAPPLSGSGPAAP